MNFDNLTLKQKSIILFSNILLSISIGLETKDYFAVKDYTINYEYVNVKDMTMAKVANKVADENIIDKLFNNVGQKTLESVPLKEEVKEENMEKPKTAADQSVPRKIWYLPTEIGYVTQWPSYGHVAFDITSWRGTGETIHPIANGTISGIYTDSYGALIVTVLHNVNGQKYTSQYVHLSSYAAGIYVGKPVTINDALGQMGTTGYSTGVHLHIAVLDCALFDPSDSKCPDLGAWYRYDKIKFSQGFNGLSSLVNVPGSWNSR